MRLVVSLTTSPFRIAHIRGVLDALFDQERRPDAVYLNLPERYRDLETYTLPEWLSDEPRLILIRPEHDSGPILKILPALEAETDPDTLIVTADDDVIYPRDALAVLEAASNAQPGTAFGSKGFSFTGDGKHIEPVRGDQVACHVLQGYGGCAYRRSHFDLSVLQEALAGYPEAFRYSDDVILSNHLAQNGVPLATVQFHTRLAHMSWGDEDPQALKYVDGGTHQRYFTMREALKEQQAWFID